MKMINVEGLPDHVVRAVEDMVTTLRQEFKTNGRNGAGKKRLPADLPVKHGKVIGSLTRTEIYDDVC